MMITDHGIQISKTSGHRGKVRFFINNHEDVKITLDYRRMQNAFSSFTWR